MQKDRFKVIFFSALIVLIVFSITLQAKRVQNEHFLATTSSYRESSTESPSTKKTVVEGNDEENSTTLSIAERKVDFSQDNTLRHIVKIECVGEGYKSSGSGTIQVSGNGSTKNWHVYTNAHVIANALGRDGRCTVFIPTAPDYYPSISNSAKIKYVTEKFPDVDFAILEVSSSIEFSDFPYNACPSIENTIGDRVRLYGYPRSGGSTLTVTEGIVSGSTYTAYGPIFKTSAKIDKGNSGGVAINLDKNCTIGMPTWATSGEIEGLGYIQSWEMLYNAGDL